MSNSCDPMDCSVWGSSIHGISQAVILERVAISFSRGSSQPRDLTWLSCNASRLFMDWAIREAPEIKKLLEEKIWKTFFDINYSNIFWVCLLRQRNQKNKNKQMRPNLNLKVLHSKGNHHNMKRQSTEWEQIFANDITDELTVSV